MPTTYAIPDGRVAMNASIWTGDGVTPKAVVSNLAFQPDFLWLKQRSAINYHFLQNSIAGATKYLASNATDAESSGSSGGWIQSFDSNGYTTVTGASNSNNVNGSGITYVGWAWKAGGTAVSNTAGTITSSVSANTTAGFSVVTYTGTGANATVGHGLGVAPSFIVIKGRDTGYDWRVYHTSVGNTSALFLNTTSASVANSTYWNNTSPTSSVFSVGSNAGMNGSTNTYVAYCFAPVAGYSAFGSYTGNGSSDGPFVYTGFRPRFVLVKSSTAAQSWQMYDSTRNPSNEVNCTLFANGTNAESTSNGNFDFLSNGFKLRNGDFAINKSAETYIYYAVAENPFKFSNAR